MSKQTLKLGNNFGLMRPTMHTIATLLRYPEPLIRYMGTFIKGDRGYIEDNGKENGSYSII